MAGQNNMLFSNHEAVLSSEQNYTTFCFGGYVIRFRAPYSLERYVDVLRWDDGYLVVQAKYSHNAKPEEEGKTPVVAIEDAIKTIFDNIEKIELDTVRDSIVESLYNKVVDLYGFDKTFNILCKALSDTFENIKDDDYVNAVTNETLVETLKHIYEPRVEVVNVMRENSDVIIDFKPVLGLKYDFDSKDRYEVYSADESSFVAENLIEETTTYTPEEKTEGTVETTTEEESESTYYYTGMAFYNAKVMNIKELFPKEQPCDVIVLLDADGNYMRDDTQIIGIDRINDRTVNSSTIVSIPII